MKYKGRGIVHRTAQPEDTDRLAELYTHLVAKLAELKPADYERYTALLAVVVMLKACAEAWDVDVSTWAGDQPGPEANVERRASITLEDIAYLRKADDALIDLLRRYDHDVHRLYVPLFASRLLLVRCAQEWSGRANVWTTAGAGLHVQSGAQLAPRAGKGSVES